MKLLTKKILKNEVAYALRWGVFLMASLTLALKIAEASAYETTKVILKNPEVTSYSILVKAGYLPF